MEPKFIYPTLLKNNPSVPGSKSFANRLLILAAQKGEEVRFKNIPSSHDVRDLLNCLTKIGVKVLHQKGQVLISGKFPDNEVEESLIELHPGEGGTTIRFLLTLLSKGKKRYRLHLHPNFIRRPWKNHLELLKRLGAEVEFIKENIVDLQGPIKKERVEFENFQTSQVLSSFMLAFPGDPLYESDSHYPYIQQTKFLVQDFFLSKKSSYEVPIDYSSLSYLIAFSLMKQTFTFPFALGVDPYQADSVLFEVIKKIGGRVELGKGQTKIYQNNSIEAFDWDCSNCPDLVPTLCYIAAYAQGESCLSGLSNLVYKESNRLEELKRLLSNFKVAYELKEDKLFIYGPAGEVPFCGYHSPHDHRMAMTASLFMRHNHGGTITNHEVVSKSFPLFYEQWL